MRLAVLTQYYPPEIGAPQSRLYELVSGFAELKWGVRVITAAPNYPEGRIQDGYRRKFVQTESIGAVPVKRYWLYPSNSKRILPRLVSMVSFALTSLFAIPYIFRFKPDFVFVESPPLALAFSGLILAKICRAKFILNVSDLWPLTAKELGAISDGALYRGLERLERYFYKRAFLCTGQSQEIVDYISGHGGKRVLLFRNGVDCKRFKRTLSNINRPKMRLVYAGLLGVAQGIAAICRNVNFGDLNVEFHIYGAGAERKEIEQFLTKTPFCGIYLHAAVNRDEVPHILGSHDGALIPLARRIYGAVPSKIYEAMASGLPIIFYGEGEGANIVNENQVGWAPRTGNILELENSIREFSRDSEARTRYSANGIKCASNVFDRGIQIRKLNDYLVAALCQT